MAAGIPAGLTPGEGRRFGLAVGLAFLALGGIGWWRGGATAPLVFGALGGTFVLAGLLLPSRLGPVYRVWMGIAFVISRIMTPILLGLVFFLVITPIGLVMRLFGKNGIRHRARGGSLWFERSGGRGTMSNQF